MPESPEKYTAVAKNADEIEAELLRLGWWSDMPPTQEAIDQMGAFGQGTMTFANWLQFIFLPRVRELIEERGEFPSESNVGAYAVREFDGQDEASALVSLLIAFDGLFG